MSISYYQRKFMPSEQVCLRPDNRAFRFADGCFESIRVIGGRPVFPEYHFNRMQHTLLLLQVQLDWDLEHFRKIIQVLIEKNSTTEDARLRLSVWRGGVGAYLPEASHAEVLIEYQALETSGFKIPVGKSAMVYRAMPLPTHSLGNAKTLNKIIHVNAAIAAKREQCEEAVLLNQKGQVAEAISSNFYLLIDGALHTPPLESGCLNGTIRRVLLDHHQSLGIPLIEREIELEELGEATEILTSNAIAGFEFISELGGKKYFGETAAEIQSWLNRLALSST